MQDELDQWKKRFHVSIKKKSYGYRLDQGTRKSLFWSSTANTEYEFIMEMAEDVRKPSTSTVIGSLGRNCCMELLKTLEIWVPDQHYVGPEEKHNA